MINVIPKPQKVIPGEGAFTFRNDDDIRQELDSSITGEEAYRLSIKPDGITLKASTPTGLFRGTMTIRQLADESSELPCCEIEDAPRFAWRGVNLDCGRHFMEVDFIKKQLDIMAYYKMNVLHWLLSQDQGWRIQIKKHPKLTEIGAWREEIKPHGGFYTHDDVREIVSYAAERHIMVVPEIDMPGHCLAALAVYPELSCSGGPFKITSNGGIYKDVYCAGKEEPFDFLEDVLSEVMELFPAPYIHVGCDECPKARWKKCPLCQERIKKEGLKDEHELQSYFVKRMEKFITAKGKTLIGWDEILEGGLPETAIVQSWRGVSGAIEAVKQGHKSIVSPTTHTYFDYPLARTDIKQVYSFDPVPKGCDPGMILGSEANMWTEYAPQHHVERKLYPRAITLAEVLWSQPESFDKFRERLRAHYPRLDRMKVNYGKEGEPKIMLYKWALKDVRDFFKILKEDRATAISLLRQELGLKP